MSGVLLSPPDERDYPVSMVADISNVNIPADFKVWQPPVENQGRTGNCVAQSLANIMECIWVQEQLLVLFDIDVVNMSAEEYLSFIEENAELLSKLHKDYSVGYIYGSPLNIASTGMFPRNACEIMLKQGDVLREDWECKKENPQCSEQWEAEVTDEIKAKAQKINAYIRINNKEEMQAFILKYKLPIMLIAESKAYREGVEGRHATVCYGWISEETYKADVKRYNDYDESEYEDLLFTNSWGKWYHNSGRGACKSWEMEEIWGIVPMDKIKLTDITGRWSEAAIEREVDRGTIKGYEDGTFKPTQAITREEAAVMFDRSHTATEKMLADIIKRLDAIEKMK